VAREEMLIVNLFLYC